MRYEKIIDRARQIATNIANSLPVGDDASVETQVAAAFGEYHDGPGTLDEIARELDYDAGEFRGLVERELSRLRTTR